MNTGNFSEASCGCIMRRADGIMLRYCSPAHGGGTVGIKRRRSDEYDGVPRGGKQRMPAYEKKKAYKRSQRTAAYTHCGRPYDSKMRNLVRGYHFEYGPAKVRKK